MVSGEVEVEVVVGAMVLVLKRMYVFVEGMAGERIEVVGKAIEAIEVIEMVAYVSVMAEVCGLEAVSEVSEVYEVYEV